MENYLEQARKLKRMAEKCREKKDFEMERLLFGAVVSIEELVALLNATRNTLLEKIEEQRNVQEKHRS